MHYIFNDCLWGSYCHLTRHNLSTNFVQIVSCHKFSCKTMDSVYLIDSESGYDREGQSLYKRKCGAIVKLALIISIILTMGALVVALLWLLYNHIYDPLLKEWLCRQPSPSLNFYSYQEDKCLDSLKQYYLKQLHMYLKCDSTVYLVFWSLECSK